MSNACSCTSSSSLEAHPLECCQIFSEHQRFARWLEGNINSDIDKSCIYDDQGVTLTASASAFSVAAGQILYIFPLSFVETNKTIDRSSILISASASNGTAEIVDMPDPIVKYTPNTGFTGADTFDVSVCLNPPYNMVCGTATLTVNVT